MVSSLTKVMLIWVEVVVISWPSGTMLTVVVSAAGASSLDSTLTVTWSVIACVDAVSIRPSVVELTAADGSVSSGRSVVCCEINDATLEVLSIAATVVVSAVSAFLLSLTVVSHSGVVSVVASV